MATLWISAAATSASMALGAVLLSWKARAGGARPRSIESWLFGSIFEVGWSDAAGAALAGALLVGLGTGSTPTIVTTYARERCSAEDYALAFSVATAALGIGQLLGPLAAGALADRFPLYAWKTGAVRV